MNTTAALATVLGVGLVTYAMRSGLILTLADRELPEPITRALRYVAPAVLAALVVSLITDPDAPNTGLSVAEVAGLVVAIPVAWKSRNMVVTLIVGMVVLWVVRALG